MREDETKPIYIRIFIFYITVSIVKLLNLIYFYIY